MKIKEQTIKNVDSGFFFSNFSAGFQYFYFSEEIR